MSSVNVETSLFECPTRGVSYSGQISSMFQIELDEAKLWSPLACRACVLVLDETRELKRKVIATQESLLLLESDLRPEVPVELEKVEDAEEVPVDSYISYEIADVPEDSLSGTLDSEVAREKSKSKRSAVTRSSKRQLKVSVPVMVKVAKTPVKVKRKQRKGDSSNEDEWGEGDEESAEEEEKKVQNNLKRKGKSIKELRAELLPLDHMMIEMGLLNCPTCGDQEETFYKLNKHMQTQHKRQGYVSCCDRMLGPKQAHDHMRYHLDKDIFKCDVCTKVCTSGYSLVSSENYFKILENVYL